MLSVPYSRYFIYPVPWYSFLIVLGVAAAIFLAVREERRIGLKKDTVIDLSLWLLPIGIIGARIYYVIFSWEQFVPDPVSVFRIWEGGIAIYGAIIAGLIVLFCFSRHRRLSPLVLCDLIAPGLALAQGIGRWGNYFNMEAFGLPLSNPAFCFFPLAVKINEHGNDVWHMATFFYESVWDISIFVYLILFRNKSLRRRGDVFFFYAFLYAAGRFVIEDLRMDSLYASSSVRASQLFSALVCFGILLYYSLLLRKARAGNRCIRYLILPLSFLFSAFQVVYSLFGSLFEGISLSIRLPLLVVSSLCLIVSLFLVHSSVSQEVSYADNKA